MPRDALTPPHRRRTRIIPSETRTRIRPLLAAGLAMLIGFIIGVKTQLAPLAENTTKPSVIDIGFSQHMAHRNDQVVLLAQIFMREHQSELLPLATQILDSHLLALGQLNGWMQLWNASPRPANKSMDWILAGKAAPTETLRAYLMSCESSGAIPGMASQTEIKAIVEAQGTRRDQVFLEIMQLHLSSTAPVLGFVQEEAMLEPVRTFARKLHKEHERILEMIQAKQTKPEA